MIDETVTLMAVRKINKSGVENHRRCRLQTVNFMRIVREQTVQPWCLRDRLSGNGQRKTAASVPAGGNK